MVNDQSYILKAIELAVPIFQLENIGGKSGPLPFGLPLIGLPLIGLPPFGLKTFGLMGHLDYPHLD